MCDARYSLLGAGSTHCLVDQISFFLNTFGIFSSEVFPLVISMIYLFFKNWYLGRSTHRLVYQINFFLKNGIFSSEVDPLVVWFIRYLFLKIHLVSYFGRISDCSDIKRQLDQALNCPCDSIESGYISVNLNI